MINLFCFGDSDTYGYDARSRLGERLPESERWPELFGNHSGWHVVNEGLNGRKIPSETWSINSFDRSLSRYPDANMMILMLGTNDLLGSFHPDACAVGKRMEQFILHAQEHPVLYGQGKKILLIAPPHTDIGRFGADGDNYDRESRRLGAIYREIAGRHGLWFADAGQWGIPLAHDGVHLTPEGHRIFAETLWRYYETNQIL